ncbi:hypothetical protein B0A55_06227 [Friedmanniomyces simplex]|uniref:Uncharacterized protein n=1 Tax=Friedmanniomyces simplex TaxID=329884 RepID=A0A4U0X420_9PEZI|nr:hypothetical protein B0A55_06227 [Friedmanniomyces simplex]
MTDKAELEYLLAKARFELAHQHYEVVKESAALEIKEVESRIKKLGQRAIHYGEEDSELEVLLAPFDSTTLHADAAVPARKMKAVKAKVGWEWGSQPENLIAAIPCIVKHPNGK